MTPPFPAPSQIEPSVNIMISYSRNDSKFVNRLEADLKAHGYSLWIDRRNLQAGQVWDAEIRRAIDKCDILLVVLSPDALASHFVRQEYLYALRQHKNVIPLRYHPTRDLPPELYKLQYANFEAGIDFEETYASGLNELVNAIALHAQAMAAAREAEDRAQRALQQRSTPTRGHRTAPEPLAADGKQSGFLAGRSIALVVATITLVVGGLVGGRGLVSSLGGHSFPNVTSTHAPTTPSHPLPTIRGQITEYAIPTPGSRPTRIAVGPDGALWFTEFDGNKIGRITTDGHVTEYAVPTRGGSPDGITAGPDGAIWFTEFGGDKIGRITTIGGVTEFPVLTSQSVPDGITAGPDGALWFTEFDGNKIGRITTDGRVTEYAVPTRGSSPVVITSGPDHALWFAEFAGNNIGRISTSGHIVEYPIRTPKSEPRGITAGPDGALWFTEGASNKIARLTTDGEMTEFSVKLQSSPLVICDGPDGALWFTEGDGNRIGRVITNGGLTEISPPTPGSSPFGITSGPNNSLWFTEADGDKIAMIS